MLISDLARQDKVSEGDLTQRANYDVSNAGTGGDSLHGVCGPIANVTAEAAGP